MFGAVASGAASTEPLPTATEPASACIGIESPIASMSPPDLALFAPFFSLSVKRASSEALIDVMGLLLTLLGPTFLDVN